MLNSIAPNRADQNEDGDADTDFVDDCDDNVVVVVGDGGKKAPGGEAVIRKRQQRKEIAVEGTAPFVHSAETAERERPGLGEQPYMSSFYEFNIGSSNSVYIYISSNLNRYI